MSAPETTFLKTVQRVLEIKSLKRDNVNAQIVYEPSKQDSIEFLGVAPGEPTSFEVQLNTLAFEASKKIVDDCVEAIPKKIKDSCAKGILECRTEIPECARVNVRVMTYLIEEIHKLGLPCIISGSMITIGPRGEMTPTKY